MAKKTRYPKRTAAKPAPKRPSKPAAAAPAAPAAARATTRPVVEIVADDDAEAMPARSSGALTAAEIDRAAALEAQMAAEEKAQAAEQLRRRQRREAGEEHHLAGDINAPLSVRAAHEYAYVARDVKRIALTAGLMIGILAVIYVLINVLGAGPA